MHSLIIMPLILLAAFSCTPLNNDYDRDELLCGSASQSGQLVKIRSLTQTEYPSEELAVYRQTEGAWESVPVTAKGCFSQDSEGAYLIAAKNNLGAIVEKGRATTEVILESVQDSDVSFTCPQTAISSAFDLQQQFTVSGEASGFDLQFSVKSGEELVRTIEKTLGRSPLDILQGLSDGSYNLQLKVRNVLKGTASRSYSCNLTLDNLAPEVNFQGPAAQRVSFEGFAAVDPSEKIILKPDDASASRVLSCWTEVQEAALARDPEAACELKDYGPELSPPTQGYWILSYQAVDEAGQRSAVYRQKILSYHEKELQNLELEMQIAAFQLESGAYYQAAQKIVRAEQRRKEFFTVIERQKLEANIRDKLYNVAIQNMPRLTLQNINQRNSVLSADGSLLATVDENQGPELCVYEFATGKLLWKLPHPNGEAVRMTFNAKGDLLLTSGQLSGDVFIWDTRSGELIRTLKREPREGFQTTAFELALSDDQRYLGVPGYDDYVYIYDLNSGSENPLAKVGQKEALYSFSLSPDGALFAASDANKVRIYSRNGVLVEEQEYPFNIRAVAFLGSRELVAAVLSKKDLVDPKKREIDYYYSELGRPKVKIAGGVIGGTDKIIPSPDRRHFIAFGIASDGGKLFKEWRQQLAELQAGRLSSLAYTPIDKGNDTVGVYWAQDSFSFATLAVVQGVFQTVRVTSIVGNDLFTRSSDAAGFAFAADGKSLSVYLRNKELQFWDLSSSVLETRDLDYPVEGFAARGDKYLTVDHPTPTELSIKVWDRKTSKLLYTAVSTNIYANSIRLTRFIDQNSFVYFKDDKTLQLVDLTSGSERSLVAEGRSLPPDYENPLVFDISADSKILLVGSSGGYVELIDIESGKPLYLSKAHATSPYLNNFDKFPNAASSVAFVGTSYDFISGGADGKILTHKKSLTDGSYVSAPLAEVAGGVISIATSQRYAVIASTMNFVILIKIEDGSYELLPVDGLFPAVVAISPNEEWIASTSFSSEAYLWKRETLERMTRIEFSKEGIPINALKFSDDSRDLITAYMGRVFFIPTERDSVLKKISDYIREPQSE